ncbi:DUF2855 family protein [Streptomyces sp. NPDC097619]|uniref:DUF2855 family protein n=1 Tax=Streptomyces sp. NPDC097619 TaxID=3157228 RepID=UPI00332F6149
MADLESWDLVVRRDDLDAAEIRPARPAALREGEVRLTAEKFALTAITATYSRLGESDLPFFEAFAAPEGHGRVPTWGYARVTESRHPGVAVGTRYYGFLPLSSEVVLTASPTERGFADTAPERDYLHPWYREYLPAGEPDAFDDHRLLLRPLYPASFNLAEHLGASDTPRTVLITSASSKTALALAGLVRDRADLTTVGVTSAAHLEFVRARGLYDRVLTYEDLPTATLGGPVVLVDFTGQAARLFTLYEHFQPVLEDALLVGYTHPGAEIEPPDALTDPVPWIFFTPTQEGLLIGKEGEESYRARYAASEESFVRSTPAWLDVVHASGPEALLTAYRALMSNALPPHTGTVLTPR